MSFNISKRDGDDSPIEQLVDVLADIDTTGSDATLNATTISDNNGGRIELGQQPTRPAFTSGRQTLNQNNKASAEYTDEEIIEALEDFKVPPENK